MRVLRQRRRFRRVFSRRGSPIARRSLRGSGVAQRPDRLSMSPPRSKRHRCSPESRGSTTRRWSCSGCGIAGAQRYVRRSAARSESARSLAPGPHVADPETIAAAPAFRILQQVEIVVVQSHDRSALLEPPRLRPLCSPPRARRVMSGSFAGVLWRRRRWSYGLRWSGDGRPLGVAQPSSTPSVPTSTGGLLLGGGEEPSTVSLIANTDRCCASRWRRPAPPAAAITPVRRAALISRNGESSKITEGSSAAISGWLRCRLPLIRPRPAWARRPAGECPRPGPLGGGAATGGDRLAAAITARISSVLAGSALHKPVKSRSQVGIFRPAPLFSAVLLIRERGVDSFIDRNHRAPASVRSAVRCPPAAAPAQRQAPPARSG